jgi:hypothetical protein
MRSLEIEYPPRLRLGTSDSIRLSLRVLPQNITNSTAVAVTIEQPDHSSKQQTFAIPLPYDTYNISARAQLTVPSTGLVILGAGSDIQPLERDITATWRWIIQPIQIGTQTAIISIIIEYTPKQLGTIQLPLKNLALPSFTITIVSTLGFNDKQIRIFGLIGSILSITAITIITNALNLFTQIRKLWPISSKKPPKSRRKG